MSEPIEATEEPLKPLTHDRLLDVVVRIRRLLFEIDNAEYVINASFAELGGAEMEELAVRARRALSVAAQKTAALGTAVEKLPAFMALRKTTLEERKKRR